MAMVAGVWMTRFQPANRCASGPLGRHAYAGRVLKNSCARGVARSLPHVCACAGSMRGAGSGPVHTPLKSGLPSGPRGAGAVRFGLPSAVRGMPGVFRSSHCAPAGAVPIVNMSATRPNLIPPSACQRVTARLTRMVTRTRASHGDGDTEERRRNGRHVPPPGGVLRLEQLLELALQFVLPAVAARRVEGIH